MVRARDESSAAMPPRPAPKRSPCRPLDILVLVVGDGVAGEITHARPPWLRSSPMIERKGRPGASKDQLDKLPEFRILAG
jgi:hypothetical protein